MCGHKSASFNRTSCNLQNGLKEILQLRPVSFEWKNQSLGGRKIGLLAQELRDILPEVVEDETIIRKAHVWRR